jgi:hypothetical protein
MHSETVQILHLLASYIFKDAEFLTFLLHMAVLLRALDLIYERNVFSVFLYIWNLALCYR